MHSSSQPLRSHCQNCNTELKGPYCHSCGQHDFDVHRSFGHVALELLESFFHFEGKFFQGTFDLLFRPGSLTKEFNAGKRASQMPPLRLYIFISLVFFLAPSDSTRPPISGTIKADSPAQESAEKVTPRKTQQGTAITWGPNVDQSTRDNWEPFIREKLSHRDLIKDHFFGYLPKMMLACVPLFALLSLLVFRKAGMNYLQHLVFSLHLHSFFMLFHLVSVGWSLSAGLVSDRAAALISAACMIYMPVYAYLSLRNVFGHHRRGTLLRGCLLLATYGLVLAAGFVVTIIVAVILA